MSEKVPPEFEWIKPGVRAKCKITARQLTIASTPVYDAKKMLWECSIFGVKSGFICSNLKEIKRANKITLTLTRDQSQDIVDILTDVLHYGPSEDLEWLKKQIEEKLK